jgi:hypothetical protein
MSFPCTHCQGSGEDVIGHVSGDPQLDRPVPCPECIGDKYHRQRCANHTAAVAIVRAWWVETPKSHHAQLDFLCADCLEEHSHEGLIVKVEEVSLPEPRRLAVAS